MLVLADLSLLLPSFILRPHPREVLLVYKCFHEFLASELLPKLDEINDLKIIIPTLPNIVSVLILIFGSLLAGLAHPLLPGQ